MANSAFVRLDGRALPLGGDTRLNIFRSPSEVISREMRTGAEKPQVCRRAFFLALARLGNRRRDLSYFFMRQKRRDFHALSALDNLIMGCSSHD